MTKKIGLYSSLISRILCPQHAMRRLRAVARNIIWLKIPLKRNNIENTEKKRLKRKGKIKRKTLSANRRKWINCIHILFPFSISIRFDFVKHL